MQGIIQIGKWWSARYINCHLTDLFSTWMKLEDCTLFVGCTSTFSDIDVKQCFLRELKEAKILVVKWIPGSENEADIFTKNLDDPIFKRYADLLLGEGSVGGKGGDTE